MTNDYSTIATLLKIPSLERSYVAAGRNGSDRRIDRIDILEHPWPEVEEYLLPNIFCMTSFWWSKTDKTARINLIKSMIEHNCSGVGIMPALHLGKMVDPEIIELGNLHSFPIIILDEDCRYSEIIKEFYRVSFQGQSDGQQNVLKILSILDQYKSDGNLMRLGIDLERMFARPLIISKAGEHYISAHVTNTKALLKIHSIYSKKSYAPYTPFYPYIDDSTHLTCVFGSNSYMVLFNNESSSKDDNSPFLDIAAYLLPFFDGQNKNNSGRVIDTSELSSSDRYYLFYIKLPNLSKVLKKNDDYFVYNYSWTENYVIGLRRDSPDNNDSVFTFYNKLMKKYNPTCLVITDYSLQTDHITRMSKYVIEQMSHLILNGVFITGELPILNLLNIAPTTMKANLISKYNSCFIDGKAKHVYQDTTRLFLILRSVTKVSQLLGIHTNTAKYRIQKVLKNNYNDDFGILVAQRNMEYLLALENIIQEQLYS